MSVRQITAAHASVRRLGMAVPPLGDGRQTHDFLIVSDLRRLAAEGTAAVAT